jgi:prolipoprotein diacylglyceryl transferase
MVWKGGLASHGAAIGVPLSMYFWSKKVSKQSFLWGMDKVVVTVALAAVFIRTGNLMNSEIIGKPTGSEFGFVFTHSTSNFIQGFGGFVEDVEVSKPNEITEGSPVDFNVSYSRKIKDTARVSYVISKAEFVIDTTGYMNKHVDAMTFGNPVSIEGSPGNWIGTMRLQGIPRHPTQLYEAGFYLFIFLILYSLYPILHKREGAIFGIFLIGIFGWRIFVEVFKENQVAFEDGMSLNMGQWLSIPLVLTGIYLLIRSQRQSLSE